MAASLRPRRGKRSTAISKNIILKRGEVFFEVPDTGIGTGNGKIVMGDGTTAYGDLPYFTGDTDRFVKSVNMEIPDLSGNVNINKVALADNLYSPDNNESYGTYLYRTSGGTSDVNSGEALLSYIRGNMTVSGRIIENLSCNASSAHEPEEGEQYTPISASINAATWRACSYASASGTNVFTYNGSNWKDSNNVTVTLASIGVEVTGDIYTNDTVTIIFVKANQGVLHTFKPSYFRSVGLNIFDKNTMVLSNYTINASGVITASSGSYIAYCKAPYSNTAGYVAYNGSIVITGAGFTTSVPAAGVTVNKTGVAISGALATVPIPKESKDYNTGYICISSTNITNLCIHPRWSGTNDATTAAYSISSITIPTKDASNIDLPFVSYGLPAIGAIADEINFDLKMYIQKIGHYAYSAANLETVQGLGVDYDYDNNHIFYVLGTPVHIPLSPSISGSYTVHDFGVEYFEGTVGIGGAGDTTVLITASHLYGQNLRDKLRRDVLTISAQTLSDAQKTQVLSNIGAASAASVTQLNNDLFNSHFNKNNIFRGKNLGTVTSDNVDSFFSQFAISSGIFNDIFVGDYFAIQDGLYNTQWIVAGIDNYYNKGGGNHIPKHHITIIPKDYLHNVNDVDNHILVMNSTNTTGVSQNPENPLYDITGGNETAGYQAYYGSDMNQIYLPRISNQLRQVLGNHIITRSELLSNTIGDRVSPTSSGSIKLSSNWSWYDVDITLLNEVEVYGTIIYSNVYDIGIGCQQLPLFKMIPYNAYSRTHFWLRSVVTSSNFARANNSGNAGYYGASTSNYIRPLLLII